LSSRLLKNSPFTWFDELTTGFDKHVLSQVDWLRANGAGVENIGDFPFMLRLVWGLSGRIEISLGPNL